MVTCDLCDENFNKKFELSRHKFYIHDVDISTENAQPITCDLCDEIFDKTFQLSRHKFYVHNVDINNENVEEKDGKQEQSLIYFFYFVIGTGLIFKKKSGIFLRIFWDGPLFQFFNTFHLFTQPVLY